MVLDSIFNKELRLLNKTERALEKAEKFRIRGDNVNAIITINDILSDIKAQKEEIVDNKKDFSITLSKIAGFLNPLDKNKALETYQFSVEFDENNINARIGMALIFAESNKFVDALTVISKTETIEPKNRAVLETKAFIYEKMGEIDHFISVLELLISYYPDEFIFYDRILKYRPYDDKLYMKKAKMYYDKELYKESLISLQKVTEINSENSEAWFYTGMCRYKLNDLQNALPAFQNSLKIDKNNPETWLNIGLIYKKLDNPKNAIENFTEAIMLDPFSALTWYLKGDSYINLKQYDEA
ncbi:MAG: tetratricopeptide repeat protein, partial [Thermoplasmata archaeon]